MSSKDSASTTTRQLLETPLKGEHEGKALYLSTTVTSAKKDKTSAVSKQGRSKAPSICPAYPPQPFDPEAEFSYESTAVSPTPSFNNSKDALQDSYCRLCRSLQVTPCSAFLKQVGSSRICLNELKLGPQEFKAIMTILVNDSELIQADLSGNPATSREATYISELLNTNKFLTHLVMTEMNLSGEAMSVLAKTIKSCMALSNLDLSSNYLCDKDCDSICAIIEDTDGIRELKLNHNELGECGVRLGRAIADNMTLTSLDLSWNHIRGPGAVGIARGLQRNQHITIINLSWNGFGYEGCIAMGNTLRCNTSLQVVDLSSNRIHLPALHKLMDGVVRNKTLTTLLLGLNPIPAHCTTYILDRLQKWRHGNLKELDLKGVVVDKNFEPALKTLQEDRLFMVRYDTSLPLQKDVRSKLDPKNIFNIDPVRILFFMQQHMETIDLFLKFDKDMSGALTKDEMKYAFELEGYPISDLALNQIMSYLETNRDGDVDLSKLLGGNKQSRQDSGLDAERTQDSAKMKSNVRLAGLAALKKSASQTPNKTPGLSRSNTFV